MHELAIGFIAGVVLCTFLLVLHIAFHRRPAAPIRHDLRESADVEGWGLDHDITEPEQHA